MIDPKDLEALIKDLKFDRNELEYEQFDPGKVPSDTDLSSWETSLTDPAQHNNQQFRYLVHAVSDSTSGDNLIQKLAVLKDKMLDDSIEINDIDLLTNPEKITEKRVISTSLIDQDHTDTWRAVGYILRVPVDNILKTCAEDCGTDFMRGAQTTNTLYQKRDTNGIANPNTVLAHSSPKSYNEIVLAGTGRTGQKVEIVGVFIKIFPDGEEVDPESTSQIRYAAYRLNVPIIKIKERVNEYADSKPETYSKETGFGVNDNRIRYMFDSEKQLLDVAIYGGKKSRSMTPDERRKFCALTREYLTTNPDPTIERLVTEAEKVPDSTLQQKVEEERKYQKQKSGLFPDTYLLEKIFPNELDKEFSKYIKAFEPMMNTKIDGIKKP